VAALLLFWALPPVQVPARPCVRPAALGSPEAPALGCEGGPGRLPAALALLSGRGLDPGVAGARELELLPGIGPARAAAIVAARERRPTCRAEDLLEAHGIGPHTLAGLRGLLSFGGDPRCRAGATGAGG
jgi:competence protein ComEA